jgi:hypothetical protein
MTSLPGEVTRLYFEIVRPPGEKLTKVLGL